MEHTHRTDKARKNQSEIHRFDKSKNPAALHQQIRRLEPDLVAWSLKYEVFRANLLQDPKGVIERELGQQLPKDLNIEILLEDAVTCFFVIPAKEVALTYCTGGQSFGEACLEVGAKLVRQSNRYASCGGENDAETRAGLIAKIWSDPEFATRFYSEPKVEIETYYGLRLSTQTEICIVEETPNELYIVLPEVPDETGNVLAPHELALLAAPQIGSAGAAPSGSLIPTNPCICF